MRDERLRRAVAYMWVVVGLAILQLAWVFGSRYMERREAERQSQEATARKYQPYAGKGTAVHITQFYASPGAVPKGERTLVCYGVENAANVRIEPPVEPLHPALTYCFWVKPQRTTTYQLLADGSDGTKASQALTIQVGEK